MFELNLLKPGNLIELDVKNNNDVLKLNTIVENIDENILTVFAPFYEGKIHYIEKNAKINVFINYKDPVDNKFEQYSFECKLKEKFIENNISLLTLEKISDFEKIQRRNFYRLPLLKELIAYKNNEEFNILSENISGNGIKAYTKEHIDIGDIIFIELKTAKDIIVLKSKVIHATFDNELYRYEFSCEFIEMSDKNTNILMKFINKKQTENIKNSLGYNSQVFINTDVNYSDFYTETTFHKFVRLLPIIAWACTLIAVAYAIRAFQNNNFGLNVFFSEFNRKFKPEFLVYAKNTSYLSIALSIIGLVLSNLFNKEKRLGATINYLLQMIVAGIVMIVYMKYI